MLSDISQTEKDKCCMISLKFGILKIIQTNIYNKTETLTDLEKKLAVTSGEGGGTIQEWESRRYKLLHGKISSTMYCTTWGI